MLASATPDESLKELAYRDNDAIEVTPLWHPRDNFSQFRSSMEDSGIHRTRGGPRRGTRRLLPRVSCASRHTVPSADARLAA